MAIEFNGKRNVNNFKIGKEMPNSKDVQKEEKVTEQQQVVDNKFVPKMQQVLTALILQNQQAQKLTKIFGAMH